jgi:hypothetical protein
MANVTETATFETGIYQIETTDPVLGGANGIANVQARQLANRTKYLKERADQVDAAKGTHASLDARIDELEADVAGTSPDTMNALTAVVMQAVAESGLALREVMKTINQRFQTGQATIRNTGVVSGCNVTAGGTGRLVNLSSGIIYLNAQRRGVVAQTSTASIAQNTGTETGYVYLYLDNTGDLKATNLNEAAPANTLLLYTVTVPAGNTAEDLTGCTLTKTATTQADYPLFVAALPYVSVTLPYSMDDANYLVDLELVSLSGASQQLGCLTISNKTTTGFRINLNGTADNVVVNWTARKMTL